MYVGSLLDLDRNVPSILLFGDGLLRDGRSLACYFVSTPVDASQSR